MASEITFLEALIKCQVWCPTKIFWNDEIIWDDDLDITYWKSYEEAIKDFAEANPNYGDYIVEDIGIAIVEYHHSHIYLYGGLK